MDDLDLLSAFREDPEPLDPEVVARARAALLATIEREQRPAPIRVRRPRRRWPVAVGVAAAAVALALALPAILPAGRGHGGAPSAAAAALLNASKIAARQAGEPVPGPGQFVYTKTQRVDETDTVEAGQSQEFSVLVPITREAWIGTDGSGRLLETRGMPEFLSDRDRALWEASGRPDLGGNDTSDESFQPGGLTYLDLSSLPTDPDQLRTMIEKRQIEGGPPGDVETFAIIGDLLRETYAPPALRAALYQIASELPGIELLGSVKDPVGRDGVGVAYTGGGDQHQLIFDPKTSALLGERAVVVNPGEAGLDVEAGTVVDWSAYLASGVVDSTTERP